MNHKKKFEDYPEHKEKFELYEKIVQLENGREFLIAMQQLGNDWKRVIALLKKMLPGKGELFIDEKLLTDLNSIINPDEEVEWNVEVTREKIKT